MEGDDHMFGHHLPKALEILGDGLDTKQLHENCKVVVIGVAGWSPGGLTALYPKLGFILTILCEQVQSRGLLQAEYIYTLDPKSAV